MMYYRVNTLHIDPISIIVYRTLMKKYNISKEENINIEINEEHDENIEIYHINKIYCKKIDGLKILNFRITMK